METIDNILSNFDFTYCFIVNVLTYLIIKEIDRINKQRKVKTWVKRVILLSVILLTGVLYWLLDKDLELIINSAILAPVAWSWLFKPLCAKLGIDYNKINDTINK